MTADVLARSGEAQGLRLASRATLAALLAALVYRFGQFAADGISAVAYPFELDYGEGIVWQQMRWIFTDKAYASIDGFPAIVFHYTPLYHALTSLIASATGWDELAVGRATSLASTCVGALVSGFLVHAVLGERADPWTRRACALIAGLLVFTFVPVAYWAPLMRVDMLALTLSLAGLATAMLALERPRLIHAAALLFVAAVYTKQTSIAAPAAVFLTLLVFRPGLALRGLFSCLGLGLAALLALGWVTDGGFYRHVFLYNVNRFEPDRLRWIAQAAGVHALYVGVAALALVRSLAGLRARHGAERWRETRLSLAAESADLRLVFAVAYLAVTTLMLMLVGKSGSSINYFLEWFCAIGLFAAIGVQGGTQASAGRTGVRSSLAIGVPAALAVQAIMTPPAPYSFEENGSSERRLQELSAEIAAADRPVISDNMVLLLRSGREVVWEPAIFAELASTGVWDERPFVRRIRNGEFAFFMTFLERGAERFDERYNPAVAEAIDVAYPVKERLGAFTIHRAAKGPVPSRELRSVPPAQQAKP